MRLLIDTHIALWAIADDRRLSLRARQLLLDSENQVHVSAASIWEIAIKRQKNPAVMPIDSNDALAAFTQSGFLFLPISPAHAVATQRLPALHADPFDRMLIAQAQCEPLHLLTADARLASYSDLVMLV